MKVQFFLFISFFSINCFSQSSDNQPLTKSIQQLEKQFNLICNYDPDQITEYSFSGNLDCSNPENCFTKLLYQTPFDFEITQNSVLIFLPEKQNFRLCGTLKDAKFQNTLAFANIFSNDKIQGTQSDENGNFDFTFSCYKNQIITFSYVGYKSKSWMIHELISKDCQDIFLELDAELFGEEILVKDYILTGIKEGENYGSVKMDYRKLSKNHGNIEYDILKTAQLISGVTSIDESASNLQIRGGTVDQNLILWEGATIYDPGHFFGMISSINPFVVDEVEVFKGVFEPSYDNRVGGIIDISLTDSVGQKFHGGIGTTFTEAHAFLEVPIIKNRLSAIVSGRNTINGIYNSPTLSGYSTKVFQDSKVTNTDIEDRNQELNFYDWNVKILGRPTEKILLKAGYFSSGNTFNFRNEIFDEEDDDFHVSFTDDVEFSVQAVSLSAEIMWSQKWKSAFSFSQSSYQDDYQFTLFDEIDEEFVETNDVFNDIEDKTFGLTNDLSISPNLDFQIGYDFNQKAVNFNIVNENLFEQDWEDINFIKANFHNAFAAFQFQKEKWQINGGLRATYFQELQDLTFSPRLTVQVAVSEGFKLKFSGGILQQYISQLKEFGDNDLGINNQVWVINFSDDDDIEPFQEAQKVAAGFVVNKNGWLLDVEGYYNKITGLSSLNPIISTSIDVPAFFSGESTAKGIDFLLKKRLKWYQFWASYSLSEVRYNFEALDASIFPASNDHRHNLSIVNSFSYKNFHLSFTYQFRSGLPFSQPDGIDFIVEGDDEYHLVNYEQYNQSRLPDYQRLDASLRYEHHFKSGLKTELAFSMVNLLNRENVFSRDYFLSDIEEDNEEPGLFLVDRLMLKRVPLVLIRLWW